MHYSLPFSSTLTLTYVALAATRPISYHRCRTFPRAFFSLRSLSEAYIRLAFAPSRRRRRRRRRRRILDKKYVYRKTRGERAGCGLVDEGIERVEKKECKGETSRSPFGGEERRRRRRLLRRKPASSPTVLTEERVWETRDERERGRTMICRRVFQPRSFSFSYSSYSFSSLYSRGLYQNSFYRESVFSSSSALKASLGIYLSLHSFFRSRYGRNNTIPVSPAHTDRFGSTWKLFNLFKNNISLTINFFEALARLEYFL